jgi:F0F1-type ATP synthase assembly protein I
VEYEGVAGKNDSESGQTKRFARKTGAIINIVWTFVAVIFGGFFGGYLIDRWLETTPAFTLVLTFLGLAAAVYVVIRETPRLLK